MDDKTAGARGTLYEFRLCTLCVVRGYTRGLKNFRLRYQVSESEVGKFDDIVFDEGKGIYQVFQLKHKEKEGKYKISSTHLFNQNFNAELNLLKYVYSYFSALRSKVDIAVVLTNIDFDFKKLTSIKLHLFTPARNAIFDTSKSFPGSKCYKFDNDPNIVQKLKKQAVKVSKELREKLEKQKPTIFSFLLSIFSWILKLIKKDDEKIKYEQQQKTLRKKDEVLANFLENLKEDDIKKALEHIVYAVGQPNDTELEEIIKSEIKDHFKLQCADTVYNTLEKAITKWCNMKEPFIYEVPTSNPYVIYFRDAKIFFQQNVKNVSFGDNAPISSFTGRLDELTLIRNKLEEKHDVIVSQSVTIIGLGGIGKTELTKQFIKEYGQTDFYGRVIWIEAESDESVTKSFRALAEKLEIQDRENKLTTTIIDQIFDYFHEVKVLFIFDNFDEYAEETDYVGKPNDKEKNFVIYCRKIALGSTKKHRPYFIFTSRNRECLPDVSSLDLTCLTKEDAKKLVKNELIIKNYSDANVEELTDVLQCFPLALQQAIAYINKQHEIEGVLGGGYDIQKYLAEFAEKKDKLLNYRYKNKFGEYERTTLITWDVTFDAIKKDKINGPDAIQILQFMSYLYADRIDSKMFLSLFKNDSTRTGEAFLLLQKYSLITKVGESTCYQIHRLVQSVVELTLKHKKDILKEVWNLIFPKLYESYLDQKWYLINELMEQCTIDQFLHYNNLATYIKNHGVLDTMFLEFFHDLNNRVLIAALYEDDIDTINKLLLSPEELMRFAKVFNQTMISRNTKKVLKYFVEKGYLDLNDDSLIRYYTLDVVNFDLFKFLIENGVNLNNLKLKMSIDMVNDIIQGNLDSLLGLIKKSAKTDNNLSILKECLFFASLYNQEHIVKFLIVNKVEPDCNLYERIECAPIRAAAHLQYPNVLKLLLTNFESKEKLVQILFDLLDDKSFCDKKCFETIFKKHIELGGDINDQFDYKSNSTFLCYVTHRYRFIVGKTRIVNFLLDDGADPLIKNSFGDDAFSNIFNIINRYLENPDDKGPLVKVYRKMRSKMSDETFIAKISAVLFEMIRSNSIHKISDMLFEKKDDINFRNEKGETLLINLIRKYETYFSHTAYMAKFFLDAGVDANAKDNSGKYALFYAVNLHGNKVFKLLLTKTNCVSEEILIKAIKWDNVRIVQELLKTYFELSHTFEGGKTIFEVALENYSLNTMLFLYPKIKDLGFQKGEVKRIVVKAQMALIEYIKNRLISYKVNLKIVGTLVELCNDVNAIDHDENNALHYASQLKYDTTFRYMLSKGSLVQENTLENAIKTDKAQIVQAIIPQYFKISHCFRDGLTPISLAEEFKAKNVLQFLTEFLESP